MSLSYSVSMYRKKNPNLLGMSTLTLAFLKAIYLETSAYYTSLCRRQNAYTKVVSVSND